MTTSTGVPGIEVEWDVPITMSDGTVLHADIFRPSENGRYPVLMTHGPYGKGLSFQDGYAGMWSTLVDRHPDALAGSTNRYQVWETPDPEKWVIHGYICIRVDSRGAGRSAGTLDLLSARETQDYYECIEWAGMQPWSNGRVGLLGISYYAINQWLVAARRPPHLAAICPWEGASDYYREFTHHGGIVNTWFQKWYPIQVAAVQHGVGERGRRSAVTGELVAGPETLDPSVLQSLTVDHVAEMARRPLFDEWYAERTADLARIEVPVLSATNWAHDLHTRAGFEAFLAVGTDQKWLEVHGCEHWVHFYTDYGLALQRRFFDHFLREVDNDWDEQPPVMLNVRHVDGTFEQRSEDAWPIDRTTWTKFALRPDSNALSLTAPDRDEFITYPARGPGVTFTAAPFETETEITGPVALTLYLSSSTVDADVFVTLRVIDSSGKDVRLRGAMDPRNVVGAGWLRASHRKLDPHRSLPYRPFHTHDESWPLTPGEVVELQVELWPTSLVVPPGYSIAVTVTGQDFQFRAEPSDPSIYGIPMRGHAFFLHDDETDRPSSVFDNVMTVLSGPGRESALMLPVVPRRATP